MSIANAESLFFTAQGEVEGKPLVFRSLQRVPAGVKESDYPFLVSIRWPYAEVNGSGMPETETCDLQIIFEDALIHLNDSEISRLMLIVLGNGRKDWHWYVKEMGSWMENLNTSLAEQPFFPIRISNTHQPDWRLYHDFLLTV